MVIGMRKLPYKERHRRLNLFSLERRCLREDLILVYNIFHGRLDFQHAEYFEAPAERNLRGHYFKIRHRSFQLLRRKAAYSVRDSWSVEQSHKSHCQCPIVRRFQAVFGRCMAVSVPRPSLIPYLKIDFSHGFRRLTVPLFVNQYN